MISREYFEEKFLEAKELQAWKITEKRAKLIYEKIMEFEKQDFKEALDIITEYENFSFPLFLKVLREQRAIRLEQEAEHIKQKEEDEFRLWWRSHQGARQECINNYECYSCKRKYCDLIAKDACRNIKALLGGTKTEAQVNQEMSKYAGMGWGETPF